MIEGMLRDTCIILRRQVESRNATGEYDYQEIADVACLFVNRVSRGINEQYVQTYTAMGKLQTAIEVLETDRIVYGGFEYKVVEGGVAKKIDVITGDVLLYSTKLERTRPYQESTVHIHRS